MPGVLPLDKFKEMFTFHKDVKDFRLTTALGAASRRIKKWVSDANYGTDDADIKSDLQIAEGFMAMHFLVANLNTNVRPGGMVKSERTDDGAGQRGGSQIVYFAPAETLARSQEFFDLAEEICRPYRLTDDVPAAEIEFAETVFE